VAREGLLRRPDRRVSELHWLSGKEVSMRREQQVQRPSGRSVPSCACQAVRGESK
jgi:hypothetical protein